LAIHAVAISATPEPVRGALRGGRLRLLSFQPELVQGTQKQRKGHRASAGGCLCHQLFGNPGAIGISRAGSGVVSSPIEAFNEQNGDNSEFRLSSVGRPGREIVTPPTDAQMARTIEAFATTPNPKPVSALLDINGEWVFRTVYPTLAREQSCVSCHNALQPDKAQWHLNDVIGAFAIDVPVSPFLRTVAWQGTGIALGLFLALALAGLTISLMHFRQLEALDASAAKLGRTQNFLDNIIENMPVSVAVKDARDRCYVLINRTA
jgi:hypothetical protein